MIWPFVRSGDDLRLFVRLTPKSSRDGIDGLGEDPSGRPVLKARVTAAPEKGKANKALLKLLAKELGLPPTRLTITSGDTSRLKTIEISDADTALEARLVQWFEEFAR